MSTQALKGAVEGVACDVPRLQLRFLGHSITGLRPTCDLPNPRAGLRLALQGLAGRYECDRGARKASRQGLGYYVRIIFISVRPARHLALSLRMLLVLRHSMSVVCGSRNLLLAMPGFERPIPSGDALCRGGGHSCRAE